MLKHRVTAGKRANIVVAALLRTAADVSRDLSLKHGPPRREGVLGTYPRLPTRRNTGIWPPRGCVKGCNFATKACFYHSVGSL